MGREAITRVLELVRELNEEELQQVREAVSTQLGAGSRASSREVFHRALLAAGLVKEIKTPTPRADAERPLVSIQGKPLSETIVEERR